MPKFNQLFSGPRYTYFLIFMKIHPSLLSQPAINEQTNTGHNITPA